MTLIFLPEKSHSGVFFGKMMVEEAYADRNYRCFQDMISPLPDSIFVGPQDSFESLGELFHMDNKLLGFAWNILVTKFANCLPSVVFSTQHFAVGIVAVELVRFFQQLFSNHFLVRSLLQAFI